VWLAITRGQLTKIDTRVLSGSHEREARTEFPQCWSYVCVFLSKKQFIWFSQAWSQAF